MTESVVQTLGKEAVPATEPGRWLRLLVVVLVSSAGLTAALMLARWATEPAHPERIAREFAAAIGEGDSGRARALIADPTIIMWPTYWSVLNLEHISPFGDRLDDFVDYYHELSTDTRLDGCDIRPTLPEEVSEYDVWVRCDYVLTDALAQRLEGPTGSTKGQLSFGIANGSIRTLFAIRSDPSDSLTGFRDWITATYPNHYAELQQQPDVLQLDVPIMGLVVTNYNRHTAIALLEFAEEYSRTSLT